MLKWVLLFVGEVYSAAYFNYPLDVCEIGPKECFLHHVKEKGTGVDLEENL